MDAKRRFSHDYLILIVNGFNVVLTIFLLILILVSVDSLNNSTYFVQYRPSLGLNSFKTGSSLDIFSFFVFALIFLFINLFLTYRTYKINRNFSVLISLMTTLLLILAIFEANSLLRLH
jgi:hypothetical protein